MTGRRAEGGGAGTVAAAAAGRFGRMVAFAVVLVVLAAACSSGDDGATPATTQPTETESTVVTEPPADEAPGVLRMGTASRILLDPRNVVPTDQAQMMVVDLLYDGLTAIEGPDGVAGPALAESWDHDGEFLEWTFTLRDDAVFSDGSPVTAQDVKVSLERVVARGTESLAGVRLVVVDGYDDFVTGDADELEGVVAADDRTVRIVLTEPFAPLPKLLASPLFGVLPGDRVDEDGFFDAVVGSGPFMLVDASEVTGPPRAIDSRLLVPAPGAPPEVVAGLLAVEVHRFESLRDSYGAFTAGNLDWSLVPRASVEGAVADYGDDAFRAFHAEFFFGINVDNPTLSDRRFREAIVRSLDREALADEIDPAGIALNGVVVQGVDGHTDDPCGTRCEYDLDAVEDLLDEVFGDGDVPEVRIDYFDGERERAIAEAVVADLEAAGIPAVARDAVEDDYKTFVTSGEQEVFLFGWVGVAPSADSYLAPLFSSGSPDNVTGFRSIIVDAGIAAARTFESPEERAEAYEIVERVVMSQLPVVPVVQVQTLAVVSERVSGWEARLDGTVVLESVSVAP